MTNQSYDVLLCEKEDGVALVTINRPEALNALNAQVFGELGRIFGELEDDDEVKAVILTGSGNKAFVAGADIKMMLNFSGIEAHKMCHFAKAMQAKIASITKPVIVAVNGFALGGGCELSLCCDFRIAADNARFGLPEITLGIIPGGGGTQRLTKLVGLAKAKELILTGKIIDSNEALRIGLVNQVVPADSLISEAKKLAANLAQKSAVALTMAKAAINNSINVDLKSGLDYEIQSFSSCFSTFDQKEGMTAFIEKRKPNFIDR
jgi:enoyl-CoA hydratase